MDQQEFVPGLQPQQSQGKQPMGEDEINYPAQPYYWSTKPNAPKDEPASHYDEPMVQSDDQSNYQNGYTAQENVAFTTGQQRETIDADHQQSQTAQSQSRFQSQRMEYGPDGDAFENQYRPNNANANHQQWSQPPWARPQVHRRRPARLIWFIVLGIIFIGPLLHLLGALIIGIGVLVLAILMPFLLVALVGLPFAIFSLRRGRGPFRSRPGRWRFSPLARKQYTNYWRGPWGW
jgi:hypothetical protein